MKIKNINNSIEKLKNNFLELINSNFKKWEEVRKLKGVTGVYIVYFNNEIIYIGETNNFYVRFGTDLKHISTHTLYKKKFLGYLQSEDLFKRIKKIKKTKVGIIKENLTEEEFEQFSRAKRNTEDFLKNKCRYRIKECSDKLEAEALEKFAI